MAKKCCISVKAAIVLALLLLGLLIGLGIYLDGRVHVSSNEYCELFSKDYGIFKTVTSQGFHYIGPAAEKHCLIKTTQHLKFDDEDSHWFRPVVAKTNTGVDVTLDIDVEYRFSDIQISETVVRTGFHQPESRLAMVARGELRDVVSMFGPEDFLRDQRETIGRTMRDALQTKLSEIDNIYVSIIHVSILNIKVLDIFEDKFEEVENIRVDQVVALEDRDLAVLEQRRSNETQYIALLAERDKRLQEARASVTNAQLEQETEVTEAKTTILRNMIAAESQREQQLIRTQKRLEEAIADKQLAVQKAKRKIVGEMQLAETRRQTMEVEQLGLVQQAYAQQRREILEAEIHRVRKIQGLVSLGITKTLELFRVGLQANVTAAKIRTEGYATARAHYERARADVVSNLAIMQSLNMTETQLAGLLFYRALKASTNKTVLLDYTKQAFMTEFWKAPPTQANLVADAAES